MSPEQYEKILSDKLFADVKYIGLNGGEPTLHPKLFEIAQVAANTLPKLQFVNIITNGICQKLAHKIFLKIQSLLKEKNISFNIGVSLDGDEVHHDRNRGIPGNYKAATTLISKLQEAGIITWVGCTLTKKNLYSGDDIILFAKEKKLNHFEVRLGVNIKRLNNDGFFENQGLTEDELFHLSQFFQKMSRLFSHNYFYKNLFRQLAYGEKRTAGCSWRHNGVTLDAEGNLSFCSVASPDVGNCLETPAHKLYKENMHIRNQIKHDKCANCMHDLNGPLPFKIKLQERIGHAKLIRQRSYLNQGIDSFKVPTATRLSCKPTFREAKTVIITGWYGTETHGDKAILGELFNFLSEKCPNIENIYVTTFPNMSYVVEKTIKELQETDVVDVSKHRGTIPIVNFDRHHVFSHADFVVIGGGPIERISELWYIEKAFRKAYQNNKGACIFGCGIDPVLGQFEPIVKSIIMHSTHAFFRDEESLATAKKLTSDKLNAYAACDPSVRFIKKWKEKHATDNTGENFDLCTLVRENTNEYLTQASPEEICKQNSSYTKEIAKFLAAISTKTAMLSMNNVWIGQDDRIFNRKILSQISHKEHVECFEHKYMGLHELLTKISQSKIALATRYHGHLFSLGLSTPFISIDYTGKKNKINNLLKLTNLEKKSISWDKISTLELQNKHKFIKNNYQDIRAKLETESKKLLERLENAYSHLN